MTVVAPGPYEARVPRDDRPAGGWLTAEQELADALEGQAPMLARDVAKALGELQTAKLAQAIGRAVAVGIKRRGELDLADRLHGLYEVLEDGLRMVEPDDKQTCAQCGDDVYCLSTRGWCDGCEAEAVCTHAESLYGRCVACGTPWEKQEASRG